MRHLAALTVDEVCDFLDVAVERHKADPSEENLTDVYEYLDELDHRAQEEFGLTVEQVVMRGLAEIKRLQNK